MKTTKEKKKTVNKTATITIKFTPRTIVIKVKRNTLNMINLY